MADLGRNESLQLTEVRLPYLAKVYVQGRATGSPVTLVPRRRGLSVCTTDNRDRVLAARRTDVADARWISRWFGLTGLVLTAGSAGLLYALI